MERKRDRRRRHDSVVNVVLAVVVVCVYIVFAIIAGVAKSLSDWPFFHRTDLGWFVVAAALGVGLGLHRAVDKYVARYWTRSKERGC